MNMTPVEQAKALEEYQRKFNHILGYDPAKGGQLEESPKPTPLELIRESATPQPVAEELYDYFALDGVWCGIDNRLFIDEQEGYKHFQHPLWLYVEFLDIKIKNPHAYYGCFYLPITIERNPKVVGDIDGMGIDPNIIKSVKCFISKNVEWLQDIANQKKHRTKDTEELQPFFLLKEGKSMLLEMANILKADSGLPSNMWLDQGHDLQHADRIKFQNDYGNAINHNNFCTLKLFPPMEVIGKTNFSNHEVDKFREFCRNNYENINALFRQEISEDEFNSRMIPFDRNGKPIYKQKPNNSEWQEMPRMYKFGISVVKSNNGKYNYMSNGKLLTDYWFDKAQPFQQHANNKCVAYACLDNVWYLVGTDGSVSAVQ
jgi:hypothetical protein